MSITRPTRAQIELWASGHIGRIGWCRELENTARAYLTLLDENEALRAEVTRLNGVILKAAVQTVDDSQ